MTVVNPKSISGINSITMASGSDNLLTIHSNNTTERVRVNSSGDVIVGSGVTLSPDGDIFATGITTISGNVKVGTGITLSPDGDGFFTGVVTATTFKGDGSQLSNVTSTTINTNADNRVITGSDTANTLNGESTLTFNNGQLDVTQTTSSSDAKLVIRNSNTPGSGSLRLEFWYGTGSTEGTDRYRFGYVEGFRAVGS